MLYRKFATDNSSTDDGVRRGQTGRDRQARDEVEVREETLQNTSR
jgi:hypothetical protein